jgi:hypothetical protein
MGVDFNPEMKDYLLGTTYFGKAYILIVNKTDWTM